MSHPRGGRPCRKSKVSIPEGPQRCRTSHSFPRMFTNTAPNSLNQRPPRRRLPPRPLFSQPSNAFHQTWGLSTPFPQSDLGFFFFLTVTTLSSQAFGVARGRYLIRHDIQCVSWKQRPLRNISVHSAGHGKSRKTPRGPQRWSTNSPIQLWAHHHHQSRESNIEPRALQPGRCRSHFKK